MKFYGGYIPAQGVDIIIKAASILKKHKDIRFFLLGSGGSYYQYCRDLSKELGAHNITFLDRIPYKELPHYIADSDVMLGLFGGTKKFNTAIPHKVYQALAMKKAVNTAESDGCKELLVDKENVLFCKATDAKSLADAILRLRNNEKLKNKIAKNGYETYRNFGIPKAIGKELKKMIEECIST